MARKEKKVPDKAGKTRPRNFVAFFVVFLACALACYSFKSASPSSSTTTEDIHTTSKSNRDTVRVQRRGFTFPDESTAYMHGRLPSMDPETIKKKQWFAKDGGVRFTSSNIIQIDTMNFNRTVTDPRKDQLLIAFYDPRSMAFKDLQPELDKIADQLAKNAASGEFIGELGACDVTINSWLGNHFAPELRTGWQATRKSQSTFRFGRPRFFPLVLVFFKRGVRVVEYTFAVDVKHVVRFLRLHSLSVGGYNLTSEEEFRQMFLGPGPLGLACGIDSNPLEQEAFNVTRHSLHGSLAFGSAPLDLCNKVLSLDLTQSQILWARGKGDALRSQARIRLANSTTMSNSTLLKAWLLSHREELLEEMTPDNSHKYLDGIKPLAMLLVDAHDANARLDAEAIFEPVETKLREDFNLVWSDCKEFGSQFDLKVSDCPVVVVVDPENFKFEHKRISFFTSQKDENTQAPSAKLTSWMRKTKQFQLYRKRETAEKQKGNSTDAESAKTESEVERFSGEYEKQIAKINGYSTHSDYNGTHLVNFHTQYKSILLALTKARHSCKNLYGHLQFDFSDMDKAQQIHESMGLLLESELDVLPVMRNASRLKYLWGAIERRSDILDRMLTYNATTDKAQIRRIYSKLVDGWNLMVGVFQRLYGFLHKHAGLGDLGTKPSLQHVERRAASDLSLQEFFERYASASRPVIITGLNLSAEAWTLDYFKRTCNVTAVLHKVEPNAARWGGLAFATNSEKIVLPDFIDTYTTNATRSAWYLHDWSLPEHCPQVLGEPPYRGFIQPKYFVGDYFQRSSFDGYQHSWPSLFIGSNATQSKMHIDSAGTNFWFYLLSGRKEWRFFPRVDFVNLYHDMLRENFWVDAFDPDVKKYPLFEYAEMHTATQEMGELIFIPGGNPHAVRNLEHIHGISGNYVDASNLGLHLWHMMHDDHFQSVEMFTDGVTVPHGLKSDLQPMEWGQWKSVPWHDLTYDLQ